MDVMALRGDAIDNIPGAPGIGDKGSVELIQQFGTVEGALDRADEVKKKTYRESLQNNRENILLSKELVTIHTSVPIEFSIEAMRTQPVDNAACRALFTELEFTTLLKDLAPDVSAVVTTYKVKASAEDLKTLLKEAREAGHLAVAMAANAQAVAEEVGAEAEAEVEVEPEPAQNMSLFGGAEEEVAAKTPLVAVSGDVACRLGLAVNAELAIEVGLDTPGLREALEDASLPKQVHDLKAVLRALEPHGVTLAGAVTDVMLESYLLNPTHASHTLIDIAARSTSLALLHQPTKDNPNDPKRLAEAAAAVVRLAKTLGEQLVESETARPSEILPDEPGLGGAMTKEMLFAEPVDEAGIREAGIRD